MKLTLLPLIAVCGTLNFSLFSDNDVVTKNYIEDHYYENVYKADSLFLEKAYDDSFEILDNLFEDFKPVNMEIYYEYVTYVKSAYNVGKKEKAFQNLQVLVKEYGISWNQITNDNVLNKVATESNFDKTAYDKLYTEYQNKLYPELLSELRNLKNQYNYYTSLEQLNNPEDVARIQEFKKNYSKQLQLILDTKGYPANLFSYSGLKKLNFEDRTDFFTLLKNTDTQFKNEYLLPKLKSLVEKGACNPEIYAKLYDLMQLENDCSTKYGTINNTECSYDVAQVNAYRKEIGLPPVDYKKWRFKNLFKS